MNTNYVKKTKRPNPFPESFTWGSGKDKAKIRKVTLEDVKKHKYKMLGSSFGICVQYCAWMGTKYCEGFLKKVKYYVPISFADTGDSNKVLATNHPTCAVVRFYE